MINKPIYFLHIPKTSGSSTTSFLDKQFKVEEIYPPQRWDIALNDKPISDIKDDFLHKKYKFYRGHFGFHPLLLRNKFVFTMLRSPSNRTISQFRHIERFPEGNGWTQSGYFNPNTDNLFKILTDGNRASVITNVQVRYLSSDLNPLSKNNENNKLIYDSNDKFIKTTTLHPKVSLLVAIYRLLKLDFFGLQEFHKESMLMLADKLDISSPFEEEQKLRFGDESNELHFDSDTRSLLEFTNNLDNKLYSVGKYIFFKRLLKFVESKTGMVFTPISYIQNRSELLDELTRIKN